MKHWKHFTILAILTMLLLSSCYSVVPKVKSQQKVGEGVYTVRFIGENWQGEYRKYAFNQFVKSKGHESYDFEFIKSGGGFITKAYYEYTITTPGSIPVENMKKVRYWQEIDIKF
jgi:hypothetical protein